VRNNDPFALWNDLADKENPFKPWNDMAMKDDPFAPWNDPVGDERDYKKYCDDNRIPKKDR